MFRRSERIQDNELRDLAEKIRQANQLKELEDNSTDSELPVVSRHCLTDDNSIDSELPVVSRHCLTDDNKLTYRKLQILVKKVMQV